MKRFGLSSGERVKSRTDFEKLFTSGKVLFSNDQKIKVVYLIEKATGTGSIKIAAVISSRTGNAFWRNRLKRLVRTSYRLNKENLLNLCLLKNIVLKIIFSPYRFSEKNNRLVKLEDVMPGIKDVMYKIERSL